MQESVRVGLISAGSPKRLVGEQGEDYPAYTSIHGRPILSYVVEQAILSDLELIYIWTNPDRVADLERIVDGFAGKEKIRKVLPSRGNIFDSLTFTMQEYVTADLFNRRGFRSWAELLDFADAHEDVRETPIMHISSDAPFIQSREIDDFRTYFSLHPVDYSIGITPIEAVQSVLDESGLWNEFMNMETTIKNFTRIYDDRNKKYISMRMNNLHILKPYKLDSRRYDFFQDIFDQRGVSKVSRWLKLAQLIKRIFKLPWLDDEQKKKKLYRTIWDLVRSQERVPKMLRKEDSQYTTVTNLEENIGFLMGLKTSLYTAGEMGAFFDADAQQEYDFLNTHFDKLYAGNAAKAS
ncbi:MAG: hypothetical protein QGI68_21075 [Pseudomonadales bacterium]|nr:hypothetical protein [Pseudomonadales bacterium]MDP7598038.1 hypothetical protein [Pseudomonadales bacterium]HJN49329.1 hypothetical protein [Pseudomonadales bacterium]